MPEQDKKMGEMPVMGMLAGMAAIPGMQEPMRRVADASAAIQEMQDKLGKRFPGSPEAVAQSEMQKAQAEIEKASHVPSAEPPKDKQTVQLNQVELLKFELLATKQRLLKSEEQNMLLVLQDIKKQERDLQVQEARLINETLKGAGIDPVGKSLRLVDREKGLCTIE